MFTANHDDITSTPKPLAPSRRALFGAGAALIVGGAVATTACAAPADADAELIALCAAFDRMERQRIAILNNPATPEDDETRDALVSPLEDKQANLGPKIWATAAITLEGIKAKARTLTLWAPHFTDGPRGWDDEFIASILRDLTTESAKVAVRGSRIDALPWPDTLFVDAEISGEA